LIDVRLFETDPGEDDPRHHLPLLGGRGRGGLLRSRVHLMLGLRRESLLSGYDEVGVGGIHEGSLSDLWGDKRLLSHYRADDGTPRNDTAVPHDFQDVFA